MRSGFIRDLTLINTPLPPIGALLGNQNERISQHIPFGPQKSQDASFDPQSHNMCHLVLNGIPESFVRNIRRITFEVRDALQR